jgi:hypothetical protein
VKHYAEPSAAMKVCHVCFLFIGLLDTAFCFSGSGLQKPACALTHTHMHRLLVKGERSYNSPCIPAAVYILFMNECMRGRPSRPLHRDLVVYCAIYII